MPILDIQKRARELGRIRLGQVVPTSNGKTRPEKLDRFRLTSNSRPLLEKVAELYGGNVAEWQPQGGGPKAWEVVTNSTRLPIMVPPQPISQWFEYWTAAGCKHRCDGRTNVLTDELCDPEDFGHLEALKRPTTRLNVVLRDVEGIGVWRIETHGWNAAMELPDAAEFLARAGGYVNGWVSLEPRTSKAEVPDRENGGTKIITRHFHVPIIEIDVTPAQLMAGEGRIQPPQLEGPVTETKAIESAGAGDAYTPFFDSLPSVVSYEDLVGMWNEARGQRLVGTEVASNSKADPARAEGFVEAWKARAREIKAAEGSAAQEGGVAPAGSGQPEPDAEGIVDAEIVDEDPDAVWPQVVLVAGQHNMGTADLEADFLQRTGVSSAEASAGEMRGYLRMLTTEPAA